MEKIKVGLLSFSDGRESVHIGLAPHIQSRADAIRQAFEATGEVEIIEASQIVSSNGLARKCARELKSALIDAVILNVPIFAFPNFSVVAESVLQIPTLVISDVNAGLPGLGGLQAATNMLDQCGYGSKKVWGNVEDPTVVADCMKYLRAAYTVSQLRGQVFGLIGGRSIGMGSGSAQTDMWQQTFGIDIDHMDQLEIIRRAELVEESQVEHAYQWLCSKAKVAFDNDKLTEDSLKQQIRHYYATKSICQEKDFAFVGVKCHYELSAYYCTQCLAAAFFNDPYDWDGPKEPMVYTCEGDCEGGLTMQIMKYLSRKPALFADFRYYKAESNIFYFCNCGAMATWFCQQSENAEENMGGVTLKPIIPKYQGKGCHVVYVAKETPMTFGRVTHDKDGFIFSVFTGNAKRLPDEAMEETCDRWPHMFVEPDCDHQKILDEFSCNHVHGICGNYVEEIRHFCELTGIRFRYIHD